jgi:hypothetical protein
MEKRNNFTFLSFEDKMRLLDKAEKACTVKWIDRLLAERHKRQQPILPNDKEKLPF